MHTSYALDGISPIFGVSSPGTSAYQIAAICCEADAQQIAADWEILCKDQVFLGPRWLLTWWRHYRTADCTLCVLAIRNAANRLIGLAPWYRRDSIVGGREIRFLGSGDVCSDYMTILVAPGEWDHVVREISNFLAAEQNGIDRLLLEAAEASDPTMAALAQRMQQDHGFTVRAHSALEGYRLTLPDTWEDYLASLSKQRRHRVRQIWRRVFETGQAQVHVAQDHASLHASFEILVRLHQERHNSIGHAGCFAASRFTAFLSEAATKLLECGQLRLQWIELEGVPVAASLDLISGESQMNYCSGMSVQFEQSRPGWLGFSASIRHAIENGLACYDFLRGDEPYKQHWRGERVSMVDWEFVPNTVRAITRDRARQLFQRSKQQLKRIVRKSSRPAQTGAVGEDS